MKLRNGRKEDVKRKKRRRGRRSEGVKNYGKQEASREN
jgi:hypothetical protein